MQSVVSPFADPNKPLDEEALRAANIHPETYLATDYLNHYNEVIMLLELVPDMPEMVHDVLPWEPLAYDDHYARSNYRAKELVLEAYRRAPRGVRRRLDDLIETMDMILVSAIDTLRKAPESDHSRDVAADTAARLKLLAAETVGLMNGLVHEGDEIYGPTSHALDQKSIDELLV